MRIHVYNAHTCIQYIYIYQEEDSSHMPRCLRAFSDSVLVEISVGKIYERPPPCVEYTAKPQNRISNGRKPTIKRHFSLSLFFRFAILRLAINQTEPVDKEYDHSNANGFCTRVFVTIQTTCFGYWSRTTLRLSEECTSAERARGFRRRAPARAKA